MEMHFTDGTRDLGTASGLGKKSAESYSGAGQVVDPLPHGNGYSTATGGKLVIPGTEAPHFCGGVSVCGITGRERLQRQGLGPAGLLCDWFFEG
jgi:hypothetical protein